MRNPFDAVLLIAFGGPQGRDDIRPFLQNVLRARRIPPERLDEVAHHYELFDGVSPITEITEPAGAGPRGTARRPRAHASGACRDAQLAAAAGRHAARRWRDAGVTACGRSRRRGAPQLLELRAVQAERVAGAGRVARGRASRRPRSSTPATGISTKASSKRSPIACRSHARRCPRTCAARRGSSSPRIRSRSRCRRSRSTSGSFANRPAPWRRASGSKDWALDVPEPERTSRGSVARAGRERRT